jgi:hypothetical protein
MPQPTVRVTGARELRASLKRAGIGLEDLKEANQRVGELIARLAAPRGPSRTGRLVGSLRASKAAGRARVLAGGAAVPYAGPIHWGWESRGIAPQPFIADTAKATEAQWLGQYEDAIADIIRKVETQ